MSLGRGRVLLPWLAALALGCGRPESDPVPEVEYSRCWAVHFPGPVCTLWDRKLNLWVRAGPGESAEIRAGGQVLDVQGEEVEGGLRYRKVALPERAPSLTVTLRRPDGRRGPSWTLALAEPDIPSWMREDDPQQLLQLLKEAPPRERGLVLRRLADLARAAGRDEEQESWLRQGIAADRAEKRLNGEVEKATLLVRLLVEKGRFGQARQALDSLRLPPEAPAESKYFAVFYRGLLAARTGDYRAALEEFREAVLLTEKVGRPDYLWDARQQLALLYQSLGRSREAAELFERLRAEAPQQPCPLGDFLTNQGWSRLLAREAGEDAGDPVPLLEEARAQYESCPPEQRINARLNLALARQQEGRWREARQALEEVLPLESHATLRQHLWWKDLEARQAIAEGRPERALRLYEDLAETAEGAQSLEGHFRARLGEARARLALGQRTGALAALAGADRLIDEQAWHVPAHEGRELLVAQREEATRLYLGLLLEMGDRQGAFELARRARSRLLRQLAVRDRLAGLGPGERQRWERDLERYQLLRSSIDREAEEEWKLPRDQKKRARESRLTQLAEAREALDRAMAGLGISDNGKGLAPPRPGEVVLVYHPTDQGWAGFAADERGIAAHVFELPAGEPGADVLLEPFREVLERSGRVRVLPYGRLRFVDFHALPFGGEPLIARLPVVYGLDLPARSGLETGGRRALLVADPQGNLREAREEAGRVDAAIRSWRPGWSLTRLDAVAARAGDVREALPGVSLFHYAGHGTFAGSAGWDSELPLASGSRLTLADILALPRAPSWVVLSACEGGRSSGEAPAEGIGLAQAFLLAGSRAVVAATRPVPDAIARDLSIELYRSWKPGMDLARPYQRAQQVCHERHPAAHCASFRLLER